MKVPLNNIKIGTRDGTLSADSKSVNVLGGQKRPGMSLFQQLPVGVAQGMLLSPTLGALAIVGNSIYSITTGLLVSAIPSGVGPYDIVPALPGTGIIAFKDSGNIWTLSGSTVTKITRSVLVATVLNAGTGGTDGTYALGISGGGGGVGATGTYTIAGGIVALITITSGGDGYTSSPTLSFPLGGIVGASGSATVNSVPVAMLPGFVYLDQTYYVMSTAGRIQGSALNDPTSWDALNFLMLNAELGAPVAITKQLNYLVGLATNFTEFFYDAGNPPPGSPLSPAQSSFSDIGCAGAGSITQISGLTVLMGKSLTRGRSIYMIQGTQYVKISDEFVDKVLGNSTLASMSAGTMKIAGYEFYGVTLRDLGVTLMFNVTLKEWTVWTSSTTAEPDPVVANSYNQSYFSPAYYIESNGMDLLLHESNGRVYNMLPTVYQDDGLPIDVNFVTSQLEGENSDFIRVAAAEVVGDKVASTAYIRFSDTDYASWSGWQTVNLLQKRSQTVRQGSTRRRSYHIRHTDNTALNLRTLNLAINQA